MKPIEAVLKLVKVYGGGQLFNPGSAVGVAVGVVGVNIDNPNVIDPFCKLGISALTDVTPLN